MAHAEQRAFAAADNDLVSNLYKVLAAGEARLPATKPLRFSGHPAKCLGGCDCWRKMTLDESSATASQLGHDVPRENPVATTL
jgi:hypothetical protein